MRKFLPFAFLLYLRLACGPVAAQWTGLGPFSPGTQNNVPAVAVTGSGTILAFNNNIRSGTAPKVWRSTDQGINWAGVNGALAGTGANAPNIASFTVAGTRAFATTYSSGFVYVSDDDGLTWTQLSGTNGLPARDLDRVCAYKNYLFVSGLGRRVYRSADNGLTWTNTNAGIPNVSTAFALNGFAGTATALLAYQASPFTGSQVLYRSTDDGNTWTAAPAIGTSGSPVAVLGAVGNTLVAGLDDGSLYRSADGGNTWALANNGYPGGRPAVLLATGSVVLVGREANSGGGLYYSNNQGLSWTNASANLPLTLNSTGTGTVAVTSLTAANGQLYAGLVTDSDLGVWQRPLSAFLSTAVAQAAGVSLAPAYPNPAAGSARISFTLARAGRATLRVYDAQGRLVATPFAGEAAAGAQEVRLDAEGLAAGVYHVRLQTAAASLTQPLVLVR